MSRLRGAAWLAGRLAFAAAAAGAAATGAIWSAHAPRKPPKELPALAEDAPSRAQQLASLRGSSPASPFDILVIGGGATGTGVALDAATRGLRVALLERDDFAAGTSSRSTKLVHGGVRYLEKAFLNLDLAQFSLVFNALHERATLLRSAPHLTWPLQTLMPFYSWLEMPYVWAGLKVYDLLAGPSMIHPSRFVPASEAQMLLPTLAHRSGDGRSLKGAVAYYDGQMDDARLNVTLAVTAARAGAAVANHAEVVGVKVDDATGLVCGVVAVDKLTGQKVEVHARSVVNATGVYADRIRKLANPAVEPILLASSGAHVVLPEYYLGAAGGRGAGSGGGGGSGGSVGLIIPKTEDGRVLFLLPWLGRAVAGTTDEKAEVTDKPRPTEAEVQFILDTLGKHLDMEVRESDVLSVWSGLRPLVKGKPASSKGGADSEGKDAANSVKIEQGDGDKATSNVVRDHVVIVDEDSGLVTITGGKWTTYRSMAEETVDIALQRLKHLPSPSLDGSSASAPSFRQSSRSSSKSVTEWIPLTGAEGYGQHVFAQLAQNAVVLRRKGADGKAVEPARLDTATARHLAQSYGVRAFRIVDIAAESSLGATLVPDFPVIEAEVVYCARNEMCQTAADFLLYRSRLAFLDADAAMAAVPRVIELLAAEHGWDRRRKAVETMMAKTAIEAFKNLK